MNQEIKSKLTPKNKEICKKYADPNDMDGDFDSARAAEKKADEDFKNYVRILAI